MDESYPVRILWAAICIATACRVGCIYEGYDGGFFVKAQKACACFHLLDFEAMMSKKLYRPLPKSDKEPAYQADERKSIRYDND